MSRSGWYNLVTTLLVFKRLNVFHNATYRLIALRLVSGCDDSIVQNSFRNDPDGSAATTASLKYLRERVGVPRDLTIHGARQFRAHINWLLGLISNT